MHLIFFVDRHFWAALYWAGLVGSFGFWAVSFTSPTPGDAVIAAVIAAVLWPLSLPMYLSWGFFAWVMA